MKHTAILQWLTALALLLGQWSMLAHAGDHPLGAAHDALCVVCLQGHSLDQLQHSSSTPQQIGRVAYSPDASSSKASPERPAPALHIRGPPSLLQS